MGLSTDGLQLEPDSAEQTALAAVREFRKGGHSPRRIAATLNSHGHRTRRGTMAAGIGCPSRQARTARRHPRRPPERRPGLASTPFRSRNKPDRGLVDAVTQVCGRGAIVEDVTEMGATVRHRLLQRQLNRV